MRISDIYLFTTCALMANIRPLKSIQELNRATRYSAIKLYISVYLSCTGSTQLLLSVCSSKSKNMYDASKEDYNQYLYIYTYVQILLQTYSVISNKTDKQSRAARKIHVLKTLYNCNKINPKQLCWRMLAIFDAT